MTSSEAKDYLAKQVAHQAVLDHVSLSSVEQRMMYFSESDPAACADPIGLNQEFESCCETAEYEEKLSTLLRRAYDRLTLEDFGSARVWHNAISDLQAGDHYLLVLWEIAHPPTTFRLLSRWLGYAARLARRRLIRHAAARMIRLDRTMGREEL